MFTFPEETKTAIVRLNMTTQDFSFNLSSVIDLHVGDKKSEFGAKDYTPNMWYSVCSIWDSASGLVQMWCDGKPSIKKFICGSNTRSTRMTSPIVILRQVFLIFKRYTL